MSVRFAFVTKGNEKIFHNRASKALQVDRFSGCRVNFVSNFRLLFADSSVTTVRCVRWQGFAGESLASPARRPPCLTESSRGYRNVIITIAAIPGPQQAAGYSVPVVHCRCEVLSRNALTLRLQRSSSSKAALTAEYRSRIQGYSLSGCGAAQKGQCPVANVKIIRRAFAPSCKQTAGYKSSEREQ